MTYYFNEDRAPNEPERCVLCGTYYDLVYCSICDEYLCRRDVGNRPERIKAAAAKAKKHLIEKFV